ncbi:lipid A deacylase LpxR family protein [Zavarzinia sp.]|uniref:lipid A deacylase LpxR family protein n=1 Tax=Zavarzinia sp. TaxID=2027920 RepID=UPI0035684E55
MTYAPRSRSLILAAALAAGCPAAALAEGPSPDPNGTFTFQIENDYFAHTDRYYTNGAQLTWLSPSRPPPALEGVSDLGRFFLRPDAQLRWGFSLGQTIYTPEDTETRVPDPTDRPYAAFLYGTLSFVAYTQSELNSIEIQAGVVGPSALGKDIQNGFHDLIRDTHSEGWDHQLKDEPGLNIVFDRQWRAITLVGERTGLSLDLSPNITVSLGNVATYGAAGAMLRFGQNLDSDFGVPRIRPALAAANFYDKRDGLGWYLFAGVQGRVVLRDIFLDGNTFRDSPSVDKKILVGDLQAGASVFLGATRLTYSYVVRTKEFDGQKGHSAFGALSASWSF